MTSYPGPTHFLIARSKVAAPGRLTHAQVPTGAPVHAAGGFINCLSSSLPPLHFVQSDLISRKVCKRKPSTLIAGRWREAEARTSTNRRLLQSDHGNVEQGRGAARAERVSARSKQAKGSRGRTNVQAKPKVRQHLLQAILRTLRGIPALLPTREELRKGYVSGECATTFLHLWCDCTSMERGSGDLRPCTNHFMWVLTVRPQSQTSDPA